MFFAEHKTNHNQWVAMVRLVALGENTLLLPALLAWKSRPPRMATVLISSRSPAISIHWVAARQHFGHSTRWNAFRIAAIRRGFDERGDK
jgi:hypothetical protein